MVVDIHKMITSNKITSNLMKPWGSNYDRKNNSKSKSLREKMFNKYTGSTNKVHLQVDFDPKTGGIYDKLHDRGTAFITIMDCRRKGPFCIFIQIDFAGIFFACIYYNNDYCHVP